LLSVVESAVCRNVSFVNYFIFKSLTSMLSFFKMSSTSASDILRSFEEVSVLHHDASNRKHKWAASYFYSLKLSPSTNPEQIFRGENIGIVRSLRRGR
jgi:hypothetical protein